MGMNYYLYYKLGTYSIQIKTNQDSFRKVIDDISSFKEVFKYKFENDEGYEVIMFYFINEFSDQVNIGFVVDEVIFDEN